MPVHQETFLLSERVSTGVPEADELLERLDALIDAAHAAWLPVAGGSDKGLLLSKIHDSLAIAMSNINRYMQRQKEERK